MEAEIFNVEAQIDQRARVNLAETQEVNLHGVELDNI